MVGGCRSTSTSLKLYCTAASPGLIVIRTIALPDGSTASVLRIVGIDASSSG